MGAETRQSELRTARSSRDRNVHITAGSRKRRTPAQSSRPGQARSTMVGSLRLPSALSPNQSAFRCTYTARSPITRIHCLCRVLSIQTGRESAFADSDTVPSTDELQTSPGREMTRQTLNEQKAREFPFARRADSKNPFRKYFLGAAIELIRSRKKQRHLAVITRAPAASTGH